MNNKNDEKILIKAISNENLIFNKIPFLFHELLTIKIIVETEKCVVLGSREHLYANYRSLFFHSKQSFINFFNFIFRFKNNCNLGPLVMRIWHSVREIMIFSWKFLVNLLVFAWML